MKTLLILNDAPYGSERTYNGARLAGALSSQEEHEVKTILVYCNTSSFAGMVAVALRLDGFENVRLLHGGYNEWKASGGMAASSRAGKKS
jgi:rhodanese-related sulfurtransferase